MEDINDVIRSFVGTSLTKQVLTDIIGFGKFLKRMKYHELGNFLFRVDKYCKCGDACGGIRCEPTFVFSLVGCVNCMEDSLSQN